MPAKSIMIQGTMSNAGKSVLAAGLCRIFRQDGCSVAPFKSQNMALNSFITREGLEMGRAQVMQAEAAGVEPSVRMNPILLKPNSDTGSQVIVNGEVLGDMRAADYFRYKRRLVPQILEAYRSLEAEYDVIVLEGAGSPAEINLKADDIVNMGMAKLAGAPVLLAGDIDRGGVFASLYGTVALLEPDERAMVKGTIINKFRGDVDILRPGLTQLEALTGVPVLGVVPWLDLDLDEEDSLFFASDDTLNGLGASLARMEKQSPWRATVSLLAGDTALPPEARQSVRTLTDVGNGILCAITQQDSGSSGAGVFLCDTAGHTAFTGILPLRISGQGQSTTTGYHALSATPDGRFHTLMLAGTPLFYQSPRTLEWEVIEETPREFLSGCPCCDTTLRTTDSPVIRRSFACRDNPWEYRCPHCGSKTRNRTMWPLLRDLARQGRGRTLAFSASRLELDCLAATIADAVDNVAAHDCGEGIRAGWDMRHLPVTRDNVYKYVFACNIIDYIPELLLASREVFRILQDGGYFIFQIMPYRLHFAKDEQARINITSFNALWHADYAHNLRKDTNDITHVPDCTFSFAWVQRCFLDAGFSVTPHLIWDAWSQRHEFWFEARKHKV